jgi:thioredoxin:protein disulfide reductase
MIPITIRLLMRQGKNPTLNASMYSGGIVATYTSLGVLAVMSGQMFGGLLASTGFNVTFAVVMALLGTTMLGFGDFSKLQAAGSKLGSGRASYLNTFLMGAGAGLVASPCTGPILATLLAYSATTLGVAKGSFLIFVYSLGFALPYVFLGRAAARISQVKVSPLIQVAVKLVFAAIMFTLAFYYLRIPARDLVTVMAPHWQVLALGGMVIGAILVLVWLTVESLSRNKVSTILPALVLGFGVFALSQWLTAPPAASAHASSVWYKTQEEAFAAARNEGKPIFVDSWAEWCVACKEMEVTTFVDPRVAEEFNSNWVLLKIDMTEDGPETDAMMKKYDVQSLPTFTLVGKGGNLARMESIRGAVGADGLLTKLREFRGKE